jgi:BlaI family penicillinase repressor
VTRRSFMKEIPRISEAEWEVMKVLWADSPMLSSEIVGKFEDKSSWKPKTIKTLISRLVQKEAIGYREEGRSYFYYPLVSEEECVKAENESFLKRIYGGALKPMLVHFLQDEKLSREEIEELKHILEGKKE